MTRKSAIPRRGNPAGLIPAPPFYYLQTIWTYSDVKRLQIKLNYDCSLVL